MAETLVCVMCAGIRRGHDLCDLLGFALRLKAERVDESSLRA
jgi:hypothetical protein